MLVTSSSSALLLLLPKHQAHSLKLVEPMSNPDSMVLPLSKPCQMTPFRATGTPSTPRMVPLAVVSPLVAADSVRTPAAASAHETEVFPVPAHKPDCQGRLPHPLSPSRVEVRCSHRAAATRVDVLLQARQRT